MSTFYAFYPPSSGGSSNASVGVNGTTAPTSSTEIAGVNPSGNLQPLQTTADGALIVQYDPSGVEQHVIVDSSALPTGAATSALQTTGNTSLADIDSKTPALGQALAAGSVPVVLTAAQVTTLTPPTTVTVIQPTAANLNATIVGTVAVSNFPSTQPISGTVTANQGTANTTANAWPQKITDGTNTAAVKAASTAVAATDPSLAVGLSPNSPLPAGTNTIGSINNISGTISLPTGAATSALQTTGNTSLASIDSKTPALGQALAASSTPVVLTAAQITTLTPPTTVTVTQATGTNLHTVVDSGSVTATLAAGTATVGSVKVTDGTNTATVKAASTAAVATDTAIVVAISPNNSITTTTASGTLTDRSGTTSGTPLTATTLAAINASRKYLFIQNNSTSGDIYIDFTTAATATNSVVLKPYATYEMNGNFVSTELISVSSNVASATFSAKEG